jgi:hypothetical protein
VDPNTHGVRLIGKSVLPLKRIALSPNGGKLFAGVDVRGSERRAQFVVVHSDEAFLSQFGRTFARRPDGEVIQSSGCAHIRVGLPVTKEGEAAVVSETVVLPPIDGKDNATLKQVRAAMDPELRMRRGDPAAHPVWKDLVWKERDVRLREAGIQLSVSQSSRDKEPVLSVSYRWLARERAQPLLVPPG